MTDFDFEREARAFAALFGIYMPNSMAEERLIPLLRHAYEAGAKQMRERAIEYFSLRGHVKVPNDLAALPLTEEAKP